MAKTIAEMVDKGKSKLERKKETMKGNYNAAKEDMKTGYDDLPFNDRMKTAYKKGVDAAVYIPPDADKWARNWKRKVT